MDQYKQWLVERRQSLIEQNEQTGGLEAEIESIDSAIHWLMVYFLAKVPNVSGQVQ